MDVYSTAGSGRVHGCCHRANPYSDFTLCRYLPVIAGSWTVHGCCHIANPHGALTLPRYLLDTAGSWKVHECSQGRLMEGSRMLSHS